MSAPTPNDCVTPADDAILLARSADGCELYAEINQQGPRPTIELHATSPWDTHVHIDQLTIEQAKTAGWNLLRICDEVSGG